MWGGVSWSTGDSSASSESAKKYLAKVENAIEYCISEDEIVEAADVLLILTEWNQFRNLDLQRIKELMKGDFFFDLRRYL